MVISTFFVCLFKWDSVAESQNKPEIHLNVVTVVQSMFNIVPIPISRVFSPHHCFGFLEKKSQYFLIFIHYLVGLLIHGKLLAQGHPASIIVEWRFKLHLLDPDQPL